MHVVVALLVAAVVTGDAPWTPLLVQLLTVVPVLAPLVVLPAVAGSDVVESRELPPGVWLQPGDLGAVLNPLPLLLVVVPLVPELRKSVFQTVQSPPEVARPHLRHLLRRLVFPVPLPLALARLLAAKVLR